MAQGLVFPATNRPQDVNVSLDQQTELQQRFDSQLKRWQNYKESYDAITRMFSLLNGTMTYNEVVHMMPGYE